MEIIHMNEMNFIYKKNKTMTKYSGFEYYFNADGEKARVYQNENRYFNDTRRRKLQILRQTTSIIIFNIYKHAPSYMYWDILQ